VNEPSPYQRLGVAETATFEEIQTAKKNLEQTYQDDAQMLENVEAAYDAVIMDRLRRRQEGRIKVPDRIRFPEQLSEFKQTPVVPVTQPPNWLKRLIDTPSASDILIPAAVYSILITLTVIGNISESFLSLLMSVGSFTAVYFLYRKERRFGRALLLSLVGLFFGVALGYLLFVSLQNSNISIHLSGEQVAASLVYLVLWLITSFLR